MSLQMCLRCRVLTQAIKLLNLFQYYMANIYGKYNRYHHGFVSCEAANMLIVFFVGWMTDHLLKNRYRYYGLQGSSDKL